MATAEIRARATLDKTQFDRGLTGMGSAVRQFSGLVAGMFSVGTAVSFARSMLSTADSLGNASDALGVGVENLQALRAAAEEAGVGVQGMDAALGHVTKAQAEALAGSDKTRDAFKALGISMQDIQGQSPDRVLEMIGRGLVETGNSADATAAVFELLGRGSAKTLGMLRQLGIDGLDATREKFRELGIVVDEFSVNKLDQAEEKVSRFFAMLKAKSAKGFASFIDAAEYAGKYIGAWMEGTTPEAMEAYEKAQRAPEAAPSVASPTAAPAPIAKSAREIAAEKQAATDSARLAKLSEELMMSRMSLEEKRVHLNQQLAELAKQEVSTDAEKAARIEKQLELEKKLEGVRSEQIREHAAGTKDAVRASELASGAATSISEKRKSLEDMTMGGPNVDALARIGGFIGGQSDPNRGIAERQLRMQEEMTAYLKQINERLARDNVPAFVE